MRVAILIALTAAATRVASGQTEACEASLSGVVVDEHDATALAGATAYLLGADRGAFAEPDGSFAFAGLCPGPDTLRVTHVGCLPLQVPVTIGAPGTTSPLRVALEHHAELLAGITVHAHRNQTGAADVGATLSGEQLDATAGAELADVVEALPGVRQVATGANVGRPLVDGLGGARLQVVEGGTALASQDWGDEHALEIDPFAAANVQLARAGATVRYGASRTGATLVLDDPAAPTERKLHGEALVHGASNDRTVGAGLSLYQRLGERWGYRAQVAARSSADAAAPDYVLSNTAARGGSAKARLYYADTTLSFDLGYRGFASEAGILRAAHIGNLTDLERALASDRPLVIEPRSRDIEAPRQAVVHHWVSANAAYRLADGAALRLAYAGQLNDRREYDVRRAGRSAIPSLDLDLTTHDVRAEYVPDRRGDAWLGTWGVQGTSQANRNDPNTGTRAFIPYYDVGAAGLYVEERHVGERWTVETAARLDFRHTRAQLTGLTEGIVAVDRAEWTGAASLGVARFAPAGHSLRARLAYASRTPNPAERFADGVHHALAVIERGDTSLGVEHGLKAVVGYGVGREGGLELHAAGFVHGFRDFIYQLPLPEPELTVRGAFPVYEYRQGDALLAGVDIDAHAPLGPLQLAAEAGYVYGALRGGDPLPDIAPWRAAAQLTYGRALAGRWKDYRLGLGVEHVGRQARYPDDLPRAAPPAYTLARAEASAHLAAGPGTLGLHLAVANLLDVTYRDYLDRLRFYAARPGRDVRLRARYEF